VLIASGRVDFDGTFSTRFKTSEDLKDKSGGDESFR
jgi:hypothetical protein